MTSTTPARTAVVADASLDAGSAFARALAPLVDHLILVGPQRDRMVDLATELEWTTGAAIHVVQVDVAAPDGPQQVRAAVEAAGLDSAVLDDRAAAALP
jgi:short-subunit dehydrogenase